MRYRGAWCSHGRMVMYRGVWCGIDVYGAVCNKCCIVKIIYNNEKYKVCLGTL